MAQPNQLTDQIMVKYFSLIFAVDDEKGQYPIRSANELVGVLDELLLYCKKYDEILDIWEGPKSRRLDKIGAVGKANAELGSGLAAPGFIRRRTTATCKGLKSKAG